MDASILVVDDLSFPRKLTKRALVNAGYTHTLEAANAKEALRCVNEQTPSLVLLDGSLPDSRDLSLLKKVLEISPQTKVVMVFAQTEDAQKEEAITMGAKGYIVKPFNEEKLLSVVNNVMAG
ncbi:MAG TPA: response regulator [Candidatus Scatavimonas merdigallinarum]|uniref:Stage 0 sporulation protein A homolog n=1 Tax=Candidatus Scatavimonas merdigallinarum TaxID=2840914 RepID=A0A9D0ZGY7_9FIRM|nr:response regulator [Candidatus Scatavimonas merdigallinarum]